MSRTKMYTGHLVPESCCTCGVVFGLDKAHREERLKDHGWFYCPNGHRQHYTGKTEAEKLRDELAREKHRREQTHARYRDLHSTMSGELRMATEEAKAFRHSPAQRGAFWRGYESRGCALPTDCPYGTNRGGFRRAWFAGAALEDPRLTPADSTEPSDA